MLPNEGILYPSMMPPENHGNLRAPFFSVNALSAQSHHHPMLSNSDKQVCLFFQNVKYSIQGPSVFHLCFLILFQEATPSCSVAHQFSPGLEWFGRVVQHTEVVDPLESCICTLCLPFFIYKRGQNNSNSCVRVHRTMTKNISFSSVVDVQ